MIGLLKRFVSRRPNYSVEYATEKNGGLAIRQRVGLPVTVSRVISSNGVHFPWRIGEHGFDDNHRIADRLNCGRDSEPSARVRILADEYNCKIDGDGRMVWSPCDCADISRTVELVLDTCQTTKCGLTTEWRGIKFHTDPDDTEETILAKLTGRLQSATCKNCHRSGISGSTNYENRPCKDSR
jgi:hypothetical protein